MPPDSSLSNSNPFSSTILNMEYGMNGYSPRRMSGYFDAFVQNTQTMYARNTWMSTLSCLHDQKGYLEDLLSKTATTLNALRDRQTRNERALSSNPTPRSKRKKILQNRWRTSKTIQTCENEERVILDCLQVCRNNIYTLESIINPTDMSSTAAEYNSSHSYPDSEKTEFDWNGWTDDAPLSPFQKERQHSSFLDEIPPEACLDVKKPVKTVSPALKRPPPLPPRLRIPPTSVLPPVPPNTAHVQFQHCMLSPEAAAFEPSVTVTHFPHMDEMPQELDKLSISGLMSSKRMRLIQKRRFCDEAIGHLFRRLSSCSRPAPGRARAHYSWGGPNSQGEVDREEVATVGMRRTNSV